MRYGYGYGYHYPNTNQVLYQIIILILIVLQWMATPSGSPGNLTDNGGLFIITLFILAACMCKGNQGSLTTYSGRRRGFYF